MSLLGRINAELAEPDPPVRRSWYAQYVVAGVYNAAGTIITSTYRPRPGIEARVVAAYSNGTLSADAGNRWWGANFEYYGGSSNPTTFYRAYYHTHLTASQVYSISLCPNAANVSPWSVTAVPFVGEVVPIPDVWFNDKMQWATSLGNSPVANCDGMQSTFVVEERARID